MLTNKNEDKFTLHLHSGVKDVKFGGDVVQIRDNLFRLRVVCEKYIGGQDLVDRRVVMIVDLIRPVQVFLEQGQSCWVTDVPRFDSLKCHTCTEKLYTVKPESTTR